MVAKVLQHNVNTGKNIFINTLTKPPYPNQVFSKVNNERKSSCQDPGLFRTHARSLDLNQGPSDLHSDALLALTDKKNSFKLTLTITSGKNASCICKAIYIPWQERREKQQKLAITITYLDIQQNCLCVNGLVAKNGYQVLQYFTCLEKISAFLLR